MNWFGFTSCDQLLVGVMKHRLVVGGWVSHGGLICLLVGHFIWLNLVGGRGGSLVGFIVSVGHILEHCDLSLSLSLSLNPWSKTQIGSEHGFVEFAFDQFN